MRAIRQLLIGAGLTIIASVANASTVPYPIVLDFEDMSNFEDAGFFYSGGTSQSGVVGPDYGVQMYGYVAFNYSGQSFVTSNIKFGGATGLVFDQAFSGGLAFSVSSGASIPVAVHVLAWDPGGDLVVEEVMTIAAQDAVGSFDWIELGFAFDGLVDTVSIFSSSDAALAFDNMTFGSAIVVPLPAALWLLFSAVGALGIARRRR